MTRTGLIKPVERTSEENNENDIYSDFWEEKMVIEKSIPQEIFLTEFNSLITPISKTDEILCIITESLISEDLVESIKKLIDLKKIRVYIILKNEKNNTTDQLKYLKMIAGICNIRYFNSFPGTLVLIDPHKKSKRKGYYSSSSLADFGIFQNVNFNFIKIEIDPNDIDEYFNFFKYTFWNRATHEIIKEDMLDVPRNAEKLPIKQEKEMKYSHFAFNENNNQIILDFISRFISNSENEVDDIKSIKAFLEYPISEALILNILKELGKNPAESVLLTIADMGFDKILKNSEKIPNEQIFKIDTHIPFDIIILNKSTGLIIINSTTLEQKSHTWTFTLQISPVMCRQFEKVLNWIKDRSKFIYYKNKNMKDIKNRFHYADNPELNSIDHSEAHEIPIKDIPTKSMKEFLDAIESKRDCSKFKKKNFAKLRYVWNVIPPYREAKVDIDSLYDEWSNFQRNYTNSVNWINDRLIENKNIIKDNNENTILTQFFLGKSVKLNTLEEKSHNLKDWGDYSKKREELVEKLTDFDNFILQLNKECNEISNAIINSEQIQQNEKEKNKYIEERKNLTEDTLKLEKEINEFENIQVKLNDEIKELKKELEKAKDKKRDNLEKDLKERNKLIDGKQNEINKLKKKSLDFQKEIEDIDEKIESIENSISNIKLNLGEIEKEVKNKGVLQNFITKFKEKTENKKNENKDEIPILLDKVPEKNIPHIGTLYQKKGQKYLAIQKYEEIEEAERISEFYSAHVVVDRQN